MKQTTDRLPGLVFKNCMFELPLDISQQRACPNAKQIRLQPTPAQFFLHQNLPRHRSHTTVECMATTNRGTMESICGVGLATPSGFGVEGE